jgi:hypothetical protein
MTTTIYVLVLVISAYGQTSVKDVYEFETYETCQENLLKVEKQFPASALLPNGRYECRSREKNPS